MYILSYSSKRWNLDPIFIHIGILPSSLQRLRFCPYFYKHLNSGQGYLYTHQNSYLILPNVGILALFLQTLEFLSNPSTENIKILTLSFQTLKFRLIIYTHWNSAPIFINILILILSPGNIGFLVCSFKTLGFWPYFYKHWNYHIILPKNGILAPFL